MLNESLVRMIGRNFIGCNLHSAIRFGHWRADEGFFGGIDDYPDPSADKVNIKWTCPDVWLALTTGDDDFLDEITAHCSDIREEAFHILAEFSHLPYEFFYYVWLGREEKAVRYLYDD